MAGRPARPIYADQSGYLYTTNPANGAPIWIIDQATGQPMIQQPIYTDPRTDLLYYASTVTGKSEWIIDPSTGEPMRAAVSVPLPPPPFEKKNPQVDKKKPVYSEWWFWVIAVAVIFVLVTLIAVTMGRPAPTSSTGFGLSSSARISSSSAASSLSYSSTKSSSSSPSSSSSSAVEDPNAPRWTVTFTDGLGNTLSTQTVVDGKSATPPAAPIRDGYTFDGWDSSYFTVKGDLTINAKWKFKPTVGMENALRTANDYLRAMPFSYSGLVNQLEYEGYTHDEAVYGADNCGANWNEQAAKMAKSYVNMMGFSREGLIEQLEFEGFTYEQAAFGADSVGL